MSEPPTAPPAPGSSLPRPPPFPAPLASSLHPQAALPTPSTKVLTQSALSSLIRYLDDALLAVSSRHLQRFSGNGYGDVRGLCGDLEKLVDVLWISSSPPLQIQYLLQIANTFNEYLWGYRVVLCRDSWKTVFVLVEKLDRCFQSLSSRGTMNMTEKVRLKSVVERTRMHLVKLPELGSEGRERGEEEEEEEGTGLGRPVVSIEDVCGAGMESETPTTEDVGEDDGEDEGEDEGDLEWEIEVAKVYDRTLQEIGDDLVSTTS